MLFEVLNVMSVIESSEAALTLDNRFAFLLLSPQFQFVFLIETLVQLMSQA